MMRIKVIALLLFLFLAACSSVKIVPRPMTPGATVNPADQSIAISHSGLIVTARVQDTAVGGYDIKTPIAAFYLVIRNGSGSSVDIPLDAFTLLDSDGNSLSPIPPEEVNAILNPRFSAFLPFPYVGYYDIVDLEQHRASTEMASDRPYVGEGLPAAARLLPLRTGPLGHREEASGMLYFNIEIIDESSVELKTAIQSREGRKLSFSHPFSIEK